ncbi:MAG TPA: tyrosine-type recombinase/integrase [Conexibacter sp.]|jgi:integrase
MEARRLRDEFAVEVRNGGRFVSIDRSSTVDAVADDALLELKERLDRGDVSKSTYDSYAGSVKNHIMPFFLYRTVAAVAPDDIAEWVEEQRDSGAASWSIRARWTALRMVFTHAARQGLIAASPCGVLKPHERPGPGRSRQRFLDNNEIRALLTEANGVRDRAMIGLLLFCGLRASEALGLVWSDIDFDGWIKVRYQMGRDGRRTELKTEAGRRDVVLMDDLAHLLRKLRVRSRFSQSVDLVLVNTVGRTMGYWDLLDRYSEIRDAAGLSRDATPHACRHTFASILIDQGRPVEYVSQALGHTKTTTTLDIYVHLFRRREHAAAARDALNTGYGAMLRSS